MEETFTWGEVEWGRTEALSIIPVDETRFRAFRHLKARKTEMSEFLPYTSSPIIINAK